MMKRVFRSGAVMLLLSSAFACGDAGPDDLTEPETALSTTSHRLLRCPNRVASASSASILPTGGVLSFNGHSLSLPLGAVTSATRLTIREPRSRFMLLDLRANGHEHYQFLTPITVTISYARCENPRFDRLPLTVWHVDRATGELLENMNGVDDKLTQTITFVTDHFSGYAIAN